MLREENRQIREKLRIARQESIDADLNAEKVRQRAMEASIQARETVANERRKRLEVEEEAKLRSEVYHYKIIIALTKILNKKDFFTELYYFLFRR